MTNPKPDLHVVSLRYSIQSDERFSYKNPPSISFETPEARFHLEAGTLRCEMKTHFADVGAARNAIEPILTAWEIHADLLSNRGQLRFKFLGPEIIDRSPVPPGTVSGVMAVVMNSVRVSATASVHVSSTKYPEPPPDFFRLKPDAESLLDRYYGYIDGHEPLPAMAYFCLTMIEAKYGGRNNAAAQYRIHRDVLRKMGELSSTRGDRRNARKGRAESAMRALSGAESVWLEAAVKLLIRRLADNRPLVKLPLITIADLPTL